MGLCIGRERKVSVLKRVGGVVRGGEDGANARE